MCKLVCSILGIDKLISYILTEWLQDIKKNQLPSILGGVGPMYSLVQLCKYRVRGGSMRYLGVC